MNRERGVKILLAPEATHPKWLSTRRVSYEIEQIGEVERELVSILGAKAIFVPGGAVAVKMGGGEFRVGFDPHQVLEIRNLRGKVLTRNQECCLDCLANTGEVIHHEPGSVIGRINATFECSNCHKNWYIRNI